MSGRIIYAARMKAGDICDIFSAIGQPNRLAILRCLAPYSHGDEAAGLPAGEIAARLNMAPATLSFHLRDMTYKKLLAQRRAGRRLFYAVNIPRLVESLDFIVGEVCETASEEEIS